MNSIDGSDSSDDDSSDDDSTPSQRRMWESKISQEEDSQQGSEGASLFRVAMAIPELPVPSDDGEDVFATENLATTIATPLPQADESIPSCASMFTLVPSDSLLISPPAAATPVDFLSSDAGVVSIPSATSVALHTTRPVGARTTANAVPPTHATDPSHKSKKQKPEKKRFAELASRVLRVRANVVLSLLKSTLTEMLAIAESSDNPEALISKRDFRNVVSALLEKRSILERSLKWSESMDDLCANLLDEVHYDHHGDEEEAVLEKDNVKEGVQVPDKLDSFTSVAASPVFKTSKPRESSSGHDSSSTASPGRLTMKIFDMGYRGFLYKQTNHGHWALRFFILTPKGELRSCKSDKSKHANGTRTVYLNGVEMFECYHKRDAVVRGHTNIFSVEHGMAHSLSRGFTLSAPSAENREEWVQALSKFISVKYK